MIVPDIGDLDQVTDNFIQVHIYVVNAVYSKEKFFVNIPMPYC